MANCSEVRDRDGTLTGYRIRVFAGKIGSKQKIFSETWKLPADISGKPKKIADALNREVVRFEEQCRMGRKPSKDRKFADYADYVLALREHSIKHSTMVRYRELLKRINPEIGYLKMSELQPEHLNRFYMKLLQPGNNMKTGKALSAKTVLEHHRLIHLVCEQAWKEGILDSNVAGRADPPAVKRREVEYFEIDEVNRILECLIKEPLKWQCITMLLIYTGARRGEIMGLKWDRIDFLRNGIHIDNNLLYQKEFGIYEDTPKTDASVRSVSIPQEVSNLLQEWKKEQERIAALVGSRWKDTGFCFTQESGLPMHPDSITDWLDKFAKKYGLPHINPHKFRHTHVSIMLRSGVSVVDAAKRVGHEQVSTTQNIYAHVLDGGTEEAGNAFADALRKQKNNV